ncbi:MAG: SDR family NAD(P)-dependent oxidoreductase [Rickettsiales bacterium]|nr:SDR family NAD(P)-dependent oxidoreductase [Rickettsiales bacterium]
MTFKNEHIWIIGASSGIGEALAKELASQGATLILSARRQEELETLNGELGGDHSVVPLDVSDSDAVQKAFKDVSLHTPKLDRVIFMAALYRPNDVDKMDVEFAKKLVEVNLLGAIYVTYATLPIFDKQKAGQLVLCGSVAGYTGLPGGQPYSATKAGIINFAESLHAEAQEYVDIKLINSGFVRTRITDKNKFHMPMRIEPEQAVKAIAKGLRARAFEIHFPKGFTLMTKFLKLLPYSLTLWITRKMREKG